MKSVAQVSLLLATLLLSGAPSAATVEAVTYITASPVTTACQSRMDALKVQFATEQKIYLACDCDPSAARCWAFDGDVNLLGWSELLGLHLAQGDGGE